MIDDIQFLTSALNDSIRHYNFVLDFLIDMDRAIAQASDDQLLTMSAILCDLQAQARVIDQRFLPQLNREVAANKILRPLLAAREKVVLEIVGRNKQLNIKAIGLKSLLASELRALRQGQTALSGYKSQQYTGGGIVDNSS
jgi:hypothetical protein